MRVVVREMFGEDCIALEDGERLYSTIHPALKRGELVELDFSAVSVFSSPFLNAAVGRLFADLSPSDLNRLLQVTGLSTESEGTLRRVVDNSKAYYSDPLRRQAVERRDQEDDV